MCGTVSYLTVSTDDGLNIQNNVTNFYELKNIFEESFEITTQ